MPEVTGLVRNGASMEESCQRQKKSRETGTEEGARGEWTTPASRTLLRGTWLFCSIGSRPVLGRRGETQLKCLTAGKSSDAQVRVRVTELCDFRAKNKGVRKKNGP